VVMPGMLSTGSGQHRKGRVDLSIADALLGSGLPSVTGEEVERCAEKRPLTARDYRSTLSSSSHCDKGASPWFTRQRFGPGAGSWSHGA
jgi:hypothetical protein